MTRDEALSVLGLKPNATRDEIQVAYRELAQMLHPDKFADNRRLRERAEAQMRSINEARDVLLKGARTRARTSSASSQSTSRAHASTVPRTPEQIAFEAEARAHAAETARLTVVAQARTLRERRGGMLSLTVIAGLVAFVTVRMAGALGTLIFSVSSMLLVWGIVDVAMYSNQVRVLDGRARDLLRQRDAARDIARRAREL